MVNGLAAYAAVVIASRGLGDVGFAAFSVSWSLWALSVAFLVFPLQHWIIWRSTHDGGTTAVRSALPRVAAVVVAFMAVLFIAGTSPRLFPVGGGWAPILALVGGSSALIGLGRGLLAAEGRYDSVAWIIGIENMLRLGGVTAAVLIVRSTAQWSVLALCAGVFALAPFLPQVKFRPSRTVGRVGVLAELGALAGATALATAMVQFPPAVAEWLGESPTRVSAIFATFSLGRAPLLVVLAVSTRVTEPLTVMLSEQPERVRRMLGRGALGLPLLGAFGGALGYAVGPELVVWFFGLGRDLGRAETALIAAGLVLATAGVLFTLALLAAQANRLAAVVWIAAVLVALMLAAAGVGIPVAFFTAEVAAVGLCYLALWRIVARSQTSSSAPL